ncbi:hypothetical protein pEaSNUABM29_00005 [Erwinia phage pEa_SNUABM_29]|nr:hypothetical protein pEaSNUABM29_00005 [Erwinia phage pEa_SNUABM_29]
MLIYGKPSNVLVFDLINRDNPNLPIPVSADNCIIEKITNVAVNSNSGNRNTSVRLRGVQGAGFRDQITLFYDRINLPTLFPNGSNVQGQFVTFDAGNIHAALPVLFDTYGINFSTWDLQNYSLAGVGSPNYTNTQTLSALATSPAYRGAVTIRYSRGLPVLDTSITKDAVPALTHNVDPALNQKCIDMLTYGIDFTAYKNLLTVTAAGLPQWEGLRNLLDSLGIPPYSAPLNSNTVQDVATTTAASANKDYDRVVIQTGIDEAGVKGVAYYHYNS